MAFVNFCQALSPTLFPRHSSGTDREQGEGKNSSMLLLPLVNLKAC